MNEVDAAQSDSRNRGLGGATARGVFLGTTIGGAILVIQIALLTKSVVATVLAAAAVAAALWWVDRPRRILGGLRNRNDLQDAIASTRDPYVRAVLHWVEFEMARGSQNADTVRPPSDFLAEAEATRSRMANASPGWAIFGGALGLMSLGLLGLLAFSTQDASLIGLTVLMAAGLGALVLMARRAWLTSGELRQQILDARRLQSDERWAKLKELATRDSTGESADTHRPHDEPTQSTPVNRCATCGHGFDPEDYVRMEDALCTACGHRLLS